MTTSHRATPEQWAYVEQWAADGKTHSCILELRDRLAALEGNSSAAMAAVNAKPTPGDRQIRSSTPAGSLVAQVNAAMDRVYHEKGTSDGEAEAAIHAVATWLESQGVGAARAATRAAARWLREEVKRG